MRNKCCIGAVTIKPASLRGQDGRELGLNRSCCEHSGVDGVAIEDWTGERFAVPQTLDADTARLLGDTAAGIVAGGWPALIVGDILVPDTIGSNAMR